MREIIIGDVHLRDDIKQYFEILCDRLAERVKAECIDRVVFLGDIYNQRALIRTDHQRLLIRCFAKLIKNGATIHVVVGNHDYDSLGDGRLHSLEVIGLLFGDRVKIFHRNTRFEDRLYVPYSSDLESIKKFLDENAGADDAFCHVSVSGFYLTPVYKETNGVAPDWFKVKRHVFVGHLHMKQISGNIIYPGAVFVNSFAEADITPIVLQYENGAITELSVPDFVPELPLYYIKTLKDDNFDLSQWNIDGNCYRFNICRSTTEECKMVKQRIMQETSSLKCRLQFHYITEKMTKERIQEDISIQDMFISYLDHPEYKDKKELLQKIGLEYIERLYA